MYERGKSDSPVVPAKSSNNATQVAAEVGEGRGLAKGNTIDLTRPGHRAGQGVSNGLDRVREVARRDKEAKFTALLHHVDLNRLRAAYWAINPKAATGVDEVTWDDYGKDLEANLSDLLARVHSGTYRASPSRRAYIPKSDGRKRPLGIATLEDKVLQRAVVEVLNAIYEVDFLGFSYGFRPGRSPHDALDALATGITTKEGELGARRGYPRLLHQSRSRLAAEVPRAPDRGQAGPAPHRQVGERRSDRGRSVEGERDRGAPRGISLALACQRLSPLRPRPVGPAMETTARPR